MTEWGHSHIDGKKTLLIAVLKENHGNVNPKDSIYSIHVLIIHEVMEYIKPDFTFTLL